MSSSPNAMSPSRNSISNWLKILKKSDSSNEVSSPQSSSFNFSINNNTSNLDLNDSLPNNNNINNESYNESNINDIPIPIKIPGSNTSPRKNSNPLSLNLISPQKNSTPQSQSQQSLLSSSPTPSRPFLGFKSRSSHSFRPLSQFLDPSTNIHNDDSSNLTPNNSFNTTIDDNSKEKLRSHRDSFLQQRQLDAIGNSSIFGCDIKTSTKLAHGTIYISGDIENNNNGNTVTASNNSNNNSNDTTKNSSINSYNTAYGQVPLVIVSCGSYLKTNALNVEGIFRLSGSNKRVKHLQMIFSTPPDYGAKIDWDGYTVHDAASLLRRYLSSLSEPLIPFNLYQSFRNPLLEKKELYQYLKEKDNKNASHNKPDKKQRKIIVSQRRELLNEYAQLFKQLPPIQHRVLFYLVDMLAMFNLRSDNNRMPAKNLAAIFQPSILFHPDHDMNPDEYASNSLVIEFMITYSHKILVNVHNKPKTDKQKELKIEEPLKSDSAKISRPRKESTYSLSKFGSEDCEKIDEEVGETEISKKGDFKPTIVIDDDDNVTTTTTNTVTNSINRTKPSYLSVDKSSPLKGSPLKNMFIPLDDNNKINGLDNLDAPVNLFSNKSTLSRPHSKSLSYVPHSEVVRIKRNTPSSLTSNGKVLNINDDNLTTVMSNQSGASSLLSSKIDTDNTTSVINQSNIDNSLVSSTDNSLIKELGLPQPDIIHKTDNISKDISSNEYKSDASSLSLAIQDNSNMYTTSNVESFIPPITPTTETTMNRDETPDIEEICNKQINTSNNLLKNNDYYLKNISNDETDSKEESYSLKGNEKHSDISTTSAFESDSIVETSSLPFSFQPSIVQDHQSLDDVNQSPREQVLSTTKLSSPLSEFKRVQYSHPDIIEDSSSLRKTATTPSIGSNSASINNETNVIIVKKRSNSTTNRNIPSVNKTVNKPSGLFSIVATHIPSTSLSRNAASSSERENKLSKEIINKDKNRKDNNNNNNTITNNNNKLTVEDKGKDKIKEKHTWFDKFKPRSSNSKR